MRYREGASIFYRALADHLLIELGTQCSVQLVVPEDMSPPDEDCLALAGALATRNLESLDYPRQFDGRSVKPTALPCTPHVIDCRRINHDTLIERFQSHLEKREDVVILVTNEVSLLGCLSVPFDRNSQSVFFAITLAFSELIQQVGFSAQALEMPVRFLKSGLRGIQGEFRLFEEPADRPVLTLDEVELFCSSISRNWFYRGHHISGAAVRDWALQFERYGVLREALALLQHLNRFGFIPKGEIVNRLLDLYARLDKESESPLQPVLIQGAGKSEQMLFYDLRSVNPEPKLFLCAISKPNPADHLVCFDDVVGSGNTILSCLFTDPGPENAKALKNWLAEERHCITVLVAIASERGISMIEQDPRCRGKVKVRAARILTQADSIFSLERNIFENSERCNAFRSACTDIGEQLFPRGPLGWGDCQWSVVTDYNVPDCSLPVLWAQAEGKHPWKPLFPRR